MRKDVRRISIHPHLEDLSYQRTEGDFHSRVNTSKGNTGSLYVHLYSALFGGEPAPRYKGRHDIMPNGDLRNISPDIVRVTPQGVDHIEIKGGSYKDNRAFFGVEQIENYFYLLSRRILVHGDRIPEIESGLFRYGQGESLYLFSYNTKKFVDKVSKNTTDLLIIPSNLLLFVALCSQVDTKNKATSKSQTKCVEYHRTPSFLLTSLNSSDDPIGDINSLAGEDYKKIFSNHWVRFPDFITGTPSPERTRIMNDLLLLDRLKFERFSSEDIAEVRCRHFKFKPFEITRLYMTQKDRKDWIETFKRNHHKILTELLGVRDLYFENYEAGDASEEGIPDPKTRMKEDPDERPF